MKVKAATAVNCILLAVILGVLLLRPRIFGAVSLNAVTEQEISDLKGNYVPAGETFFTDLAFSGETLPYDRTDNTFYLPLDMNLSAWETGTLSSADSSVELIFEDDPLEADKLEAISAGTRFRFYAVENGEYQECYLVLTGLPVIAIETQETPDTEVFGGMAYFWDSSTKQNWKSSSILEAKIRGNTSRTYEKKGYKLSLKKQDRSGNITEDKKSLFGLRTDDEWLLNAMYTDSSKIRDKLSIDIWNEIGAEKSEFPEAHFGTDAVYVELFFNQEYYGLYLLMEPVDSKQLDLTKEGEGGTEEYSYKSKVPQSEYTEDILSVTEFGTDLCGYELKGKHENIGREHWEPLLDYIELRDLSDDETFAGEAGETADLEGALDVWVYLQAVLGIDNRGKNMYYVAKSYGSSRKIYFVPWDLDLTWGDALSEGTGDLVWDVGLNTDLYSERINWSFGDRMIELDVDGSRSYVSDLWKSLREGVFSAESLSAGIDDLVSQVKDSGAYARDALRWPESSTGQDMELFGRMALYRLSFLDYYFDGRLDEYLGLGYE